MSDFPDWIRITLAKSRFQFKCADLYPYFKRGRQVNAIETQVAVGWRIGGIHVSALFGRNYEISVSGCQDGAAVYLPLYGRFNDSV